MVNDPIIVTTEMIRLVVAKCHVSSLWGFDDFGGQR